MSNLTTKEKKEFDKHIDNEPKRIIDVNHITGQDVVFMSEINNYSLEELFENGYRIFFIEYPDQKIGHFVICSFTNGNYEYFDSYGNCEKVFDDYMKANKKEYMFSPITFQKNSNVCSKYCIFRSLSSKDIPLGMFVKLLMKVSINTDAFIDTMIRIL